MTTVINTVMNAFIISTDMNAAVNKSMSHFPSMMGARGREEGLWTSETMLGTSETRLGTSKTRLKTSEMHLMAFQMGLRGW